ncbi:F-actin-capping protein subunit alpha [Coniosporium tulheliwenetii]|uniref:F-actin-capping protein subunit alpha n=1 Tax=Coniosporium tulheliwenetii TaxID=3383036 RepID=A0ACC2YYT2_9PEZI|nr:F-actin-capping protein subunit alpha [Cladosporium sp. JES 115]
MPSNSEALASFVESAPPGELSNVTNAINTIAGDSSLQSLGPALEKYNEEQFTTVTLPGSSQPGQVIVSSHNSLGEGRYFDVESQSSFAFDHTTQKASAVQSYALESKNADLIKSILKSLTTHANEHYPSSSLGVYPVQNDGAIAILLVANKYSPNNFWNGRWRSHYTFSSGQLTGNIRVDVHYYEDGNIASIERKYQEDLNKAFGSLSEGAFKGLRRQLPITRQKIEWEKISGYRLGQDIGGGRAR